MKNLSHTQTTEKPGGQALIQPGLFEIPEVLPAETTPDTSPEQDTAAPPEKEKSDCPKRKPLQGFGRVLTAEERKQDAELKFSEIGYGLDEWAESLRLPKKVKKVLKYLINHANRNPDDAKYLTCFPKQKKIAERTGVSLPTVERAIKLLREAGLLHVSMRYWTGKGQSGHRRGAFYTLLPGPVSEWIPGARKNKGPTCQKTPKTEPLSAREPGTPVQPVAVPLETASPLPEQPPEPSPPARAEKEPPVHAAKPMEHQTGKTDRTETDLEQIQEEQIKREQEELTPILLRDRIVVGSLLWDQCMDPEYVDETLRIAKETEEHGEHGDDVKRMLQITLDNENKNRPIPRSVALQYCLKYFDTASTGGGGRNPITEPWALKVAYTCPRRLMQALQSRERKMKLPHNRNLYRPIILKVCSNVRKETHGEPQNELQSEGADVLDRLTGEFLEHAHSGI